MSATQDRTHSRPQSLLACGWDRELGRDVMYGALLCPQYIFYTYVLDVLEFLFLLEALG